ncbi:dynamin family protein [Acidicapsa dinghuensis]|uniref:Dynamin family protein n=1 Tax=Acidicapsa dinghuensis TaxID=2218256 RepID=A0ABW1ED53_9BACT|nr:dynamin family protein [Acidicapsa dinghuensis]
MTGHIHDIRSSLRTDRRALLNSIEVLSAFALRNNSDDLKTSLTTLSEKLKKDRFNLAVLGQMKRGKSSFVNALLGAEILPTGILPLTSVITRVKFGQAAEAAIRYKSGHTEPIELHRLSEYITEANNPGNWKDVASAEVAYPSDFLRMGIDLIDTPGIGSTHLHNTSTTESYLNEIDAGIVVLSVDPPITTLESDFVRRIRKDVPKLLFVINKTDIVTPAESESVRRFLEGELRNRVGIENPELFPFSARRAMEERESQNSEGLSGLRELTKRLHHFAAEEREHTFLQSVGLDILRLAGTLRFAALVGERARSMSGDDLESKRRALESALSRCEQEFADLRHLLRQDVATIAKTVEEDLKDHVASTTPRARENLLRLKNEHPTETRHRLGRLLDQFLRDQVELSFDGWCAREDQYVQTRLGELSHRFIERTNAVLVRLQNAAGALFDVPVSHIGFTTSLTMESHLHYYTEPVFHFQLDKLVFALPRFLLRPIVFRRMGAFIDLELRRNSGRIRVDYVDRLERSVATFEHDLKSAVGFVSDNLRLVLDRRVDETATTGSPLEELDPIIAQCSALLCGENLSTEFSATGAG